MSELKEKVIFEPEVTHWDTGEILKPEKEIHIMTRDDVPFRSITDLKGYEGHEVNTGSTVADPTGFIPTARLVEMIFRSPDAFALATKVEDGDYDEENELSIIDDPIDQMEELYDLTLAQQEQNASRSANAESEHSAVQATTTTEGGAKDEAVSADVAD